MAPPRRHADLRDDDGHGERIAKLEERVFQLETTVDLRVQLATQMLRAEINMRQGRTDIANWLVFGMAAIILAGFLGVVVAYFQGRPIGAPVSIRSSEGIR